VLLGDIQCDRPLDDLAALCSIAGLPCTGSMAITTTMADPICGPTSLRRAQSVDRFGKPPCARDGYWGSTHRRSGRNVSTTRVGATVGTSAAAPSSTRGRSRVSWPGLWSETTCALSHSLTTAAIWPEDIETLASQKADILVTHEAPSSHPSGSAVIDELARAMGARLIVHGHHHVTSHARPRDASHTQSRDASHAQAGDGLTVLAVASAWGISMTGEVLWKGEKPRPSPPRRRRLDRSVDRGVNQVRTRSSREECQGSSCT